MDPLPSFTVSLGGEKFKWRQLEHHHLMSEQRPHFSPHSKAKKLIIKGQISGKLVTSGISNVAIVSVHSEKTRLKKMIMIIIIISMNKSQESTLFGGRQKLTSAMKQRPEK